MQMVNIWVDEPIAKQLGLIASNLRVKSRSQLIRDVLYSFVRAHSEGDGWEIESAPYTPKGQNAVEMGPDQRIQMRGGKVRFVIIDERTGLVLRDM